MTSAVRPATTTLQKWALRIDADRIDESVADDACVQLALRDSISRSFLEFLARWIVLSDGSRIVVTPERFERFARAWDRAEGERVVSHMQSEVTIPDDLRDEEGPEA